MKEKRCQKKGNKKGRKEAIKKGKNDKGAKIKKKGPKQRD